LDLSASDKTLDPPPLQKWAEESFAVAQVVVSESTTDLEGHIDKALENLRKPELAAKLNPTKFAIIGMSLSPAWQSDKPT
jgi:carboxymethylenebutenolidase